MGKRKAEIKEEAPGKQVKKSQEKVVDEDAELQATLGEIMEVTEMPKMGEGKWKNKTRTLVIGSRGLDYRSRHFMEDLRRMMAHAKADTKLEKKNERGLIREMAEMKNCSKVLYFEGRKKKDLFLTIADVDEGPTIRFNVEGLNTMGELKFNGNALNTSRPLLSFDAQFDEEPHWAVVKELMTQTFGTPKYHPKSQPFIDHVLHFSLHDGRVWMRNYQIILEGENKVKEDKFAPELVEIGPRIVLNLQRIQEGPFSGAAIYLNPDYVGPNERRRNALNRTKQNSYQNKVAAREHKEQLKGEVGERVKHVTEEIFVNN